ncbi:MAG: hypothetical protein K0R16_2526 [Nitrososphaeraceae archaeon]|nr:hypothetical protein [Nitrososphaeraceae archaeon]
MNDKTKKYTVKCQVCGKEIGDTSKPDFAEQHINENPGHLNFKCSQCSAKVMGWSQLPS